MKTGILFRKTKSKGKCVALRDFYSAIHLDSFYFFLAKSVRFFPELIKVHHNPEMFGFPIS